MTLEDIELHDEKLFPFHSLFQSILILSKESLSVVLSFNLEYFGVSLVVKGKSRSQVWSPWWAVLYLARIH